MTTTFMTDEEYAVYKNYATFAAFLSGDGYPNAAALNQFREDVFGWMVGQIGSTAARSIYPALLQFKLRNIEYRGVELMVSGEIEKDKVENYIKDSIVMLFGEKDDAGLEVADDSINRGVV